MSAADRSGTRGRALSRKCRIAVSIILTAVSRFAPGANYGADRSNVRSVPLMSRLAEHWSRTVCDVARREAIQLMGVVTVTGGQPRGVHKDTRATETLTCFIQIGRAHV